MNDLLSAQIAGIFFNESGNISWTKLLATYIDVSNFPDKFSAIDYAFRDNPTKFEEILGILIKEHRISGSKTLKLNEMLQPKGYFITDKGLLIKIDPEMSVDLYLKKMSAWFKGRIIKGKFTENYLKNFEFHADNLKDAFLKHDWKKFSSEERNLLETIVKELNDHNPEDLEFSMKMNLERYFGPKKWQVDVLYGIYRMLSEQGSHAGIPEELLCNSAYKLLRDSSEAVFKIEPEY